VSYLTSDELDALQASGLDPFTPYVIAGVSRSQLSVARHYGGCTYGGREYYYIPTTDELIRDDVVRWITARRKEERKAVRRDAEAKQMEML
jgi:hypothetical protein